MNVEIPATSHNRLLAVARAVFVVYVIGSLFIYLISLPAYFERVTSGSVSDISFDMNQPAGNDYFTTRAAAAGLTLGGYLLANTAASLLIVTVHTVIAGLIFWRLPQSGFGLLSAFVIFLTGTGAIEDAMQVAGLTQGMGPWLYLIFNLGALVWPVFPIWLYLFPDGRAVPRWTRWPNAACCASKRHRSAGAGISHSTASLPVNRSSRMSKGCSTPCLDPRMA